MAWSGMKGGGGGGGSASVLTSELHAHLTTIRRINAV